MAGSPEANGRAAPGGGLPHVLWRHRQRTLAVSHGATFVALACVAVYAVLPGPGTHAGLPELLGAMAAGGVVVAVLPWPRLFASGRAEPLLRLWSTISIALVGAAIAQTGGADSPLVLLYALTAVFFAAAYSARLQALFVAASLAAYLGAVAADGPPVPWNLVFLRVSLLAVVSALAGHLSRELGLQLTSHVAAREELEARADDLEYLALHDPLTGLANRSLFHESVEQALAEARRRSLRSAVLVLDLDGFKEVNDVLGHENGDDLLREVGPRLRSALRAEDVVARMGGDEFAVLLPEVAGPTAAGEVAQKLLRELARPFELADVTLGIESSVGIALFPEHGDAGAELVRHADAAMYRAKEDRSGWTVYAGTRDAVSPQRVALLGELRTALDEHQLVVHYQPMVDVADGSLRGVEALVRWQHPARGLVPPAGFVPLVEQTSLIRALTLEVLDLALAQARAWRDRGLDVPVSVNVSVRNLHSERFPRDVAAVLARRGVEPSALLLEITESAVMTKPRRAVAVLAELERMGVGLVLDDFGTGYSSLSYLTRLPVRELKIDRSFVTKMEADPQSRVIVRSMIDIARNLGLSVVAEGVEDEQTWTTLAGFGCDVAQGYHLSRPVPADELEPWLEQARRLEQASAS